MTSSTAREVAVTGIGLVTPLDSGRGLDIFWGRLVSGASAIGPINLFDTSPYACRVAAEVKGFDGVGEGGLRWYSFLERALELALDDAALNDSALNCAKTADSTHIARVGVVVGTILGGVLGGEGVWRRGRGELPPEYYLHYGANTLADRLGACGPVTTLSTACASGTDAIGTAFRHIRDGRADIVVAGGADSLSEFAFSGFSSLDALTRSVVRPFDRSRDGLALGEGACLLVLEERVRAEERGAGIYGLVSGYGSSGDANHMTAPDREGRGLVRAMEAALRGGCRESVDYINLHGTGTSYNDLMETKAVKRVFGDSAYDLPLSSIKSMLGHSFGAAGAVEAAVCLLAMKNGVLPPTINLEEADPECDLDYVPREARKGLFKSALSLSAGFGGQNGALLVSAI